MASLPIFRENGMVSLDTRTKYIIFGIWHHFTSELPPTCITRNLGRLGPGFDMQTYLPKLYYLDY